MKVGNAISTIASVVGGAAIGAAIWAGAVSAGDSHDIQTDVKSGIIVHVAGKNYPDVAALPCLMIDGHAYQIFIGKIEGEDRGDGSTSGSSGGGGLAVVPLSGSCKR